MLYAINARKGKMRERKECKRRGTMKTHKNKEVRHKQKKRLNREARSCGGKMTQKNNVPLIECGIKLKRK